MHFPVTDLADYEATPRRNAPPRRLALGRGYRPDGWDGGFLAVAVAGNE
jgi:hypothetical protein